MIRTFYSCSSFRRDFLAKFVYFYIMNTKLLEWIEKNTGKWFTSKRKTMFNSPKIKDYIINRIDHQKKQVRISFKESSTSALPLDFWMFDRILERLESQNDYVMLGARLQPPYPVGSLEEAVWTKPYPRQTSEYKVSPHICDILCEFGPFSFGYTENPSTGKRVQGAKKNISTGKQMKYCPECGEKLPKKEVKFCPECGENISSYTGGEPDPPSDEGDPKYDSIIDYFLTSGNPLVKVEVPNIDANDLSNELIKRIYALNKENEISVDVVNNVCYLDLK